MVTQTKTKRTGRTGFMTKLMKNLLSLMMATAFLLLFDNLSSMTVLAATPAIIDSGECGENLTWTFNDEGTLTISGEGDMTDWYGVLAETVPWYSYRKQIFEVVIENGITSIGSYAFSECSNLSSITIPNSVTRTEYFVFWVCTSLQSVTFEDGSRLDRMSGTEFVGCNLLRNIIIPDGVTDIYDCSLLGDVTLPRKVMLPDSVTNISNSPGQMHDDSKIYASKGSYAEYYAKSNNIFYVEVKSEQSDSDFEFYENTNGGVTITHYNYSVPNVVIPETLGGKSVTEIGDEENFPFENQLITSVTIPDTVTYIGNKAFSNTAISSISIPDGVTEINNSTFRYCGLLNNITLSSNVTHIGAYAFADSALDSIEIHENVTFIDDQAFVNCRLLREINVDTNNLFYASTDGVLFSKDMKTLICYPGGQRAVEYIIPGSVTVISPRAFSYTKVNKVTIPDAVTDLSYVFMYATYLSDVTIPTSATSIGAYAFNGCTNLASIMIPEGITTIDEYAFEGCKNLISIIIPEGITTIGDHAFYGTGLVNVAFPDSLKSIGMDAFVYTSNLQSITFGVNSALTPSDFWYTFSYCENVQRIKMAKNIFEGIEEDFSSSFGLASSYMGFLVDYDDKPYYMVDEHGVLYNGNKTTLVSCPSDLTLDQYVIPNSVTKINEKAFFQSQIREVILPDSLTTIGSSAFYLSAIESITIPDSVTSLPRGNTAFQDCYYLEIVNIGSGVSNLAGESVDNKNLKQINISPLNPYFTSVDGVVYSKDMKTLVAFPVKNPQINFTIPDEVERLLDYTITPRFNGEDYLPGHLIKQITFSSNLRELPSDFWGMFGESIGIQSVIIPESNPYFTVEDGIIYDKNKTTLLRYSNDAGENAVIPLGVSTIGELAFANIQLDSISFPTSVSVIGVKAFNNSKITTDIELPKSLKIIKNWAFMGCDFEKISIPPNVVEIVDAFYDNHVSTIITSHGSLAEKYARRNNLYLEHTDFGDPNLVYPEIIFEPSHSTVLLGEEAVVSVTATSEVGELSYQWFVDGIPSGTAPEYTFTPDTVGDYNIFCIITNTYDGEMTQVKSKTIVVNCVNEVVSDINFGYDNWNFTNDANYFDYDWDGFVYYNDSDNYEMKQDYLTILQNAFPTNTAIIKEFNRSPWGGSCFGMSAVEVLIKAGYLDPNFFQDTADETYYLTSPNYSYTTESLINYYHIMQACSEDNMPLMMKNIQWWGDANNYKNNKTIVREVKNSKVVVRGGKNNPTPVVLTFQYLKGAHAVVAYGYSFTDGKHNILISDPQNNTTPLVLTLDEDYSNPQFWINGVLHPDYNEFLVLRNTFSADELNYSNLQDKLTEFGKSEAVQMEILASNDGVAEQDYYYMNTNYDNFNLIYYDQAGEEIYRAVISDGVKIEGDLSIYGMVVNEAGNALKMLWQLPYLNENEYFEIVPNTTQAALLTDMTFTNAENGFYTNIEAGGDGSDATWHTGEGEIPVTGKGTITFYNDGYVKTDFPQQTEQRIVLAKNGSMNDLGTVVCEGTADGINILQSIYGLSNVDVKTVGTLNISLDDGINTVETGDINIIEGYPVTISSSATNDIVVQSSNSEMIQMATGSAGHAVTYYTEGMLNIVPQKNISTYGSAVKPNINDEFILGWFTDPEYTNGWDFGNDTVSGNTLLYAKFSNLPLFGNVNVDDALNAKDVTRLRRYLAGGWENDSEIDEFAADVNSDGVVSPKDVTRLRRYIAGGWINDGTLG
jgi:hypothetical protein